MAGNVHRTDREKAAGEWQQYFNRLSKLAEIGGDDPARGVAGFGFHRHGGLVLGPGIAAAVEQGVVRGGIFYECVKKGVPFALTGSILDGGPLLETEMVCSRRRPNTRS